MKKHDNGNGGMKLTAYELRESVISEYHEGQEIDLKIKGETKGSDTIICGTIEKFYSNHVSVKHNGYIESFSYWEFSKIACKAGMAVIKKYVLPDRIRKAKYA